MDLENTISKLLVEKFLLTTGYVLQFTCLTWQFDGLTLLHRFEIFEDGKVTYASRSLAKPLDNIITDTGRKLFTFGDDPCKDFFYNFFHLFSGEALDPKSGKSAANVGVTVGKYGTYRIFCAIFIL